jgi:eukaryotic-like serine/threonine-protein kinase
VSEKRPIGFEQTEHQSPGEQQVAEELSLRATTPPATLPGYRLERFLGSGTFGQVWFGHNLNTGRPVAVKFYLHRGGVNWTLLSREVKNLVQLSADRSVVQVLDVGWDAEPPYYVMEFLPSGSLEDLLIARGRLSVEESVDMIRKICVGLNHCHGKGILHCDLKPANVLLDEDFDPRLADFGQSRMSNDQSPSLGTLFYMAPEQAMLDAVPDARWDVYAVGVILYRMLTGKVPHRNQPLIEKIDTAGTLGKRLQHYRDAILHDSRPDEHRMRRGVDRQLCSIVDCCLSPDPNHRFANIQQVLAALDRRDEAKLRKPLMLLGIVGPLLLLAATSIFAARSIHGASNSATEALRTEARGSNQLAARFAARTLENELQRYFSAITREASSSSTRKALTSFLESNELTEMREQIAKQGTTASDAAMIRTRFLRHPDRKPLIELLNQRLANYLGGVSDSRPSIATMFVVDTLGNIIAIAYDEVVPEEQNSAGRNFAYRTYFHGGEQDLPRTTPVDSIKPLTFTKLSSAFQSTATGQWKVAFSTPIYSAPASDTEGERKLLGVFVATTNLGDFELLRADEQSDQLAVVIDARKGELRGTVLQHPLMDIRRGEGEDMAGEHYQLPSEILDRLLAGKDVDYLDPLADAGDGVAFRGSWLAAVAPVALPETDDAAESEEVEKPVNTDMLVLVQYRLSKVFEPVGQMKQQLLVEGALAMLSIVLVTFVMWYFVNRVTDQSKRDEQDDETPLPSYAQTVDLK